MFLSKVFIKSLVIAMGCCVNVSGSILHYEGYEGRVTAKIVIVGACNDKDRLCGGRVTAKVVIVRGV